MGRANGHDNSEEVGAALNLDKRRPLRVFRVKRNVGRGLRGCELGERAKVLSIVAMLGASRTFGVVEFRDDPTKVWERTVDQRARGHKLDFGFVEAFEGVGRCDVYHHAKSAVFMDYSPAHETFITGSLARLEDFRLADSGDDGVGPASRHRRSALVGFSSRPPVEKRVHVMVDTHAVSVSGDD